MSQPPADATCAIDAARVGGGVSDEAEVTAITTDCVVEVEAVSLPELHYIEAGL